MGERHWNDIQIYPTRDMATTQAHKMPGWNSRPERWLCPNGMIGWVLHCWLPGQRPTRMYLRRNGLVE